MTRRVAFVLAPLLVLGAGAWSLRCASDDGGAGAPGGAGEPLEVPGAWTEVTVPPGEWTRTAGISGDAQFAATFTGPQGRVTFEVRTFLSHDDTDPDAMLMQAIQTVQAHAGGDGLAFPSRRAVGVGKPAAQAEFAMTFGPQLREGYARVVRARPGLWSLAWGYAPRGANAGESGAIRRFVESLVPTSPRLWAPRFAREDMDRMIWSGEGEEPLPWAAVVAAGGLVEASLKTRLPLRGRDAIEEGLSRAAREKGETRTRLRKALATVREAEALPASERGQALEAAGDAFVAALPEALRDDVDGLRKAGTKDPSIFALGCVFEWAEFLAELGFDAPVRPQLRGLVNAFVEGWNARSEEDRKALRAFPKTWASVRFTWDHADGERRFRFRREAVAALSAPGEREKVVALPDEAALRAWYDREPPAVEDLVSRAAAFDLATRTRLLEVLEVADEGYHLGW